MSPFELLQNYGYLAIFLGSMLEGETVLIVAGLLIHHGYLSFTYTAIFAALGGSVADQLYFLIGKYYGMRVINRFPHIMPHVEKFNLLVNKYNTILILAIRFMYGFRIAGPLAIGMSQLSYKRYAVLNMTGAIIWALSILILGYLFGQTLQWFIADIKQHKTMIVIPIFIIAIAVFLLKRHWVTKSKKYIP